MVRSCESDFSFRECIPCKGDYDDYSKQIIPEVQSIIKIKKSKKDPAEGVTLLGQAGCSGILWNWVSVSPELLIQEIADGVGYSGFLLVPLQDHQGLFQYQEQLRPESLRGLSWAVIA